MNGYTLQVASTQPFRKTLHLMTWVRMAVACTPYSCQMNKDKVVVWDGPGAARCSLELRVSR